MGFLSVSQSSDYIFSRYIDAAYYKRANSSAVTKTCLNDLIPYWRWSVSIVRENGSGDKSNKYILVPNDFCTY